MTVKIAPGSDEWHKLITPSKVAAILGVSRWESPYRLWHRMKGLVEPEPEKDIFTVGHAFEPALAYLWKEDNPGWQLSPGEVQITGDADQFGFPFAVTLDRRARRGRSRRVVEFKTARSLEEWGDEFTDEAPADYVAQVSAQMLMTGYTQHPAHLVVLGPWLKHHTYQIEYTPAVADLIVGRCRDFYQSLAGDTPPPLDDTVATYECVRELHPDIDGSTALIPADLAIEYLAASRGRKDADRRERSAKTQVLDLMGNAQYGEVKVGDDTTVRVARRQPSRQSVALYAVEPKTPIAELITTEGNVA
ncbi:RecE-like exonuclease [Mycobacterium phage Typha]|uniref:RecE-like exonuclease n=1 Tax=Mycobacterium phage Typha TaxID=2517971 RepID=A0A482J6N2_9CAUD|nr:RecE-like recombination exonuclease [Mycobacterium phage Typha]QBP29720.1 RecE-like exonuclease [Mycobacterium phage Typha]